MKSSFFHAIPSHADPVGILIRVFICYLWNSGPSFRVGIVEAPWRGRYLWSPDLWVICWYSSSSCWDDRAPMYCGLYRSELGMPHWHCGEQGRRLFSADQAPAAARNRESCICINQHSSHTQSKIHLLTFSKRQLSNFIISSTGQSDWDGAIEVSK